MTQCESCKYWEPFTGDHGDCHRHAPQMIEGAFWPVRDGYLPETTALWVRTDAEDWCGDAEPREAASE